MARMMRPTASSQSKLNEKAPVSPPRKTGVVKRPHGKSTSRPSTRDSSSVQKGFEGSPKVVREKVSPKVEVKKSEEEVKEVKEEAVQEKAEALGTIIEPVVPETAAEAAGSVIPDIPIGDVKDEGEKELVGEKTECEPVADEAAPVAEETKAVEEVKEEAPAEVSEESQKEVEAETKPVEIIGNENEVLKDTTTEGNGASMETEAAEGKVGGTGVEEKENKKLGEEGESPKVADVGETF